MPFTPLDLAKLIEDRRAEEDLNDWSDHFENDEDCDHHCCCCCPALADGVHY